MADHWIFSRRELWILLQAFAPSVLIGLADPYFGWEDGRRARDCAQTRRALHDRGIDHRVLSTDDSPLRAALELLAHSDRTLIILTQRKSEPQKRRYYHFRGKAVLAHADAGEDRQILSLLPGADSVLAEIGPDLGLDTQHVTSGPIAALGEDAFFAANRAYRKGDLAAADAAFAASGADEAGLRTAKAALADPSANGSAVLVTSRGDRENQSARGFAVIESPAGIWILRSAGRDGRRMTELIPASAEKIRSAFAGLLS